MVNEIGGFLGWLIVVAYGLTILNYVVKTINKKFMKEINKNKELKKYYSFFMKNIVKYHKVFGFLTVVFILLHFLIQFNKFGLNITGIIAATIMIVQVALGAYGAYINKKRKGLWFVAHRMISVLLLISLAIHILL